MIRASIAKGNMMITAMIFACKTPTVKSLFKYPFCAISSQVFSKSSFRFCSIGVSCLSFFCTFFLSNPDLSVCTGENYIISNFEKQSALYPVPTIQTVKGRVVFFRKVREKISTLKPLTVWIFAVAISLPKTGNRILHNPAPASF